MANLLDNIIELILRILHMIMVLWLGKKMFLGNTCGAV